MPLKTTNQPSVEKQFVLSVLVFWPLNCTIPVPGTK